MIQIERDKLYSCKKKYLSIGITKTGEPLNAIAIPWSHIAARSTCGLLTYFFVKKTYMTERFFSN